MSPGTAQEALAQCFGRRRLTYTPGNEGLRYCAWRYAQLPGEEDGEPGDGSPGSSPTATATEPREDLPGDEPSPTQPPATPTETPVDPPDEDQTLAATES